MGYLLEPGALLGVASGVAMVALGAAVLRLRPLRPAGAAFAGFAVLWGGQVIAANLGQLADDVATATPWVYLYVGLLIPLYLPLLAFALLYPTPRGSPRLRRAVLAAAAVPAALLLALFALRTEWFVAGLVAGAGGLPSLRGGPLFQPVSVLSSVLGFAAALALISASLVAARSPGRQEQLALVTAALLAYVGYRGPGVFLGTLLASGDFVGSSPAAAALRVATGGLALWLVVYVAARVAVRPQLPRRRLLLAAALGPLAVGCAELLLAASGGAPVGTVGVWRLGMVALFAYAIARYSLFDLDLKLRLALKRSAMVAAVLGTFFVVGEAAEAALQEATGSTLLGVAAAGTLMLALRPLERAAEHLASAAMPGTRDTPGYVGRRKGEVYRAALEGAAVDGVVTDRERAILVRLQEELGLRASEAAALEREVLARPRGRRAG